MTKQSSNENPYRSSNATLKAKAASPTSHWPKLILICAAFYYAASAATLPFANTWWVGEVPVLSLIQTPKAILLSAIHQPLFHIFGSSNLSHGSHSPDYMTTHGWAMVVMLTAPALVLVAVLFYQLSAPTRRRWIAFLVLLAALDGVTTMLFENYSNLKLFSGVYF